MRIVLLAFAILTILAGTAKAEPKTSGDVVTVKVFPVTYADGLIGHDIRLTIRDGWHLYAAREQDHPRSGFKPAPKEVTVQEVLADGKEQPLDVWYHSKTVAKRGAAGEYRANEKTASIVFWVSADADGATISVKVKVVATDGQKTLPESVLSATATKSK